MNDSEYLQQRVAALEQSLQQRENEIRRLKKQIRSINKTRNGQKVFIQLLQSALEVKHPDLAREIFQQLHSYGPHASSAGQPIFHAQTAVFVSDPAMKYHP